MISKKKMVTGSDIADLRDELGIKSIDLYWLFGTIGGIKLTGKESVEKALNPSASILARYLAKYPEENFIPTMPTFFDVHDRIKQLDIKDDYTKLRNVGVFFGTSGWSGNRWYHGGRPSPIVQRLFTLLIGAIENEEEDGLEKFLKVVDEEAKSRGFKNGLQDILDHSTWASINKEKFNDEESDE